MGNWKIILPEATQNPIVNPSWEAYTTGWTSSGLTTYERVSTEQMFGYYAGHITGTVASGSRLYSDTMTITAGTVWTFSVYYKKNAANSSDLGYGQITWYTSSGGTIANSSGALTAGDVTTWTRYILTATPATSATSAVVSIYDDGITSGSTWHIWLDGAQLE